MTFRGTVRNGRVELDRPSDLPEGAAVDVHVRGAVRPSKGGRRNPRLDDPAFNLSALAVSSARADGALEHDHYVYGTPKRFARKSKALATAKKRKSRGHG